MNYLQEFDDLVSRFNKDEEIFHILVERCIRMFYSGKKLQFLMDLLSASDGLGPVTIKNIDAWLSSHENRPSKQMQEIVVEVFHTTSDSYLRDQRFMIAAQIRLLSAALNNLATDESNKDTLSRLSSKDNKRELEGRIAKLSLDVCKLSIDLQYPAKV